MATNPINVNAVLIQRFPLFADLSLSQCLTIMSGTQERRFSRKQIIFSQGDPIRRILLLLSGCVKLTQFGQDGDEVILRLNGPGEIVGGPGLCSEGEHTSTARTMESSVALLWDTAHFGDLIERFPIFGSNLTRVLAGQLQEMDERFREVSTEKVRARLSNQLVRLSDQMGKKVEGCFEIGLSRAELAQLTGTTLFTVSRLLCEWETQGILSSRRECVLVRDLKALRSLANRQPED